MCFRKLFCIKRTYIYDDVRGKGENFVRKNNFNDRSLKIQNLN